MHIYACWLIVREFWISGCVTYLNICIYVSCLGLICKSLPHQNFSFKHLTSIIIKMLWYMPCHQMWIQTVLCMCMVACSSFDQCRGIPLPLGTLQLDLVCGSNQLDASMPNALLCDVIIMVIYMPYTVGLSWYSLLFVLWNHLFYCKDHYNYGYTTCIT